METVSVVSSSKRDSSQGSDPQSQSDALMQMSVAASMMMRKEPSLREISDKDTESGSIDSVFYSLCEKGDLVKLLAMIRRGVVPNVNSVHGALKWTPLITATKSGHLHVVKYLLTEFKESIIVDKSDAEQWTALQRASFCSHYEIMLALMSAGADVNNGNSGGFTPLHNCAQKGFILGARLLLEHPNIEVNICNTSQATPLHLAVQNNQLAITRLLVQAGADVNARAANDLTPLHIATVNGFKEIIDFLLWRGGDATIKTGYGMDCLELCPNFDIKAVFTSFQTASTLYHIATQTKQLISLYSDVSDTLNGIKRKLETLDTGSRQSDEDDCFGEPMEEGTPAKKRKHRSGHVIYAIEEGEQDMFNVKEITVYAEQLTLNAFKRELATRFGGRRVSRLGRCERSRRPGESTLLLPITTDQSIRSVCDVCDLVVVRFE